MPRRLSTVHKEISSLGAHGVSPGLIDDAKATIDYLHARRVPLPSSVVARNNGHVMFVYDGKDVEIEIGYKYIVIVSPDWEEEEVDLRSAPGKLKKLLWN